MNVKEIESIILNDMSHRGFPVFLYRFEMQGFSEADVFGVNKNQYIYEYEIKTSTADFKNDFKKEHKHRLLRERKGYKMYASWYKGKMTGQQEKHILIPNRFIYACEPGIINLTDIPEYAGLCHIIDNTMITVKSPPLLHKEKANLRIYERVCTILSQRSIYGCSKMTFQNNRIKTTRALKDLIENQEDISTDIIKFVDKHFLDLF